MLYQIYFDLLLGPNFPDSQHCKAESFLDFPNLESVTEKEILALVLFALRENIKCQDKDRYNYLDYSNITERGPIIFKGDIFSKLLDKYGKKIDDLQILKRDVDQWEVFLMGDLFFRATILFKQIKTLSSKDLVVESYLTSDSNLVRSLSAEFEKRNSNE